MFNYDGLDVEKELSQIPPEYQDVFRQALEHELADLEQDKTDTDILHYLRRRRDDFQRGGYIRPDGRPGIVVADPELLYEQGLLGLTLVSGDEDAVRERRRTRLKVGGFVLLAVLLLFFVFRGRAQRAAGGEGEETPVAGATSEATVTPELPEVSGAGDSLQTIGGLGAALTIGRPSAIELRYARTEEVIALAIDPSRATPRGELRYDKAIMESDNPVAVWLFGTVVNYGIGLPDSLVRNLQPGDRITLSTDTGASLSFVVTETRRGASHETAAVLSQNRPGMTLFALPAAADDDVALAFAAYDVASEERQGQIPHQAGEMLNLPGWGEVEVAPVHYENTADGSLRIVIKGTTNPDATTTTSDGNSLMLSLTASGEQTPAVPLVADGDHTWQAAFILSLAKEGLPLVAELRALPGGALAMVQLGEVPRLQEQLDVTVSEAYWDAENGQAVLQVDVHNPGQGAVYLGADDIRIWQEGGDAYEPLGQTVPGLARQTVLSLTLQAGNSLTRQTAPRSPGQASSLPLLIGPGETLGIRMAFSLTELGPTTELSTRPETLQFQIGADLWEVSGLPPDRQP